MHFDKLKWRPNFKFKSYIAIFWCVTVTAFRNGYASKNFKIKWCITGIWCIVKVLTKLLHHQYARTPLHHAICIPSERQPQQVLHNNLPQLAQRPGSKRLALKATCPCYITLAPAYSLVAAETCAAAAPLTVLGLAYNQKSCAERRN